ncbi:glycosyl hydrolase family 57 [Synechococcus sp. MIT S9504]|uniref:glycosyl hydrolase family 57 n=1 Tax=Synechococcus sp. MIT S9504 TaxID=1801628 RepID=UPI0007BB4363|nr:glycosyl hydrolase family 57 [Synechococcus sp. MIT S9504]KZR85890.1 hypothetical protein MITS9504_01673 [Synechococcus sp. MIT S9504]
MAVQSAHQPAICGREQELRTLMQKSSRNWPSSTECNLQDLKSGFACALHMHQPTVPAGPNGALISHLQYMLEHPDEGDNHNAEPFAQCYRRMADLIPELIQEGCDPRIMLDYSGNLLWGVTQMGRRDITEALHYLACDEEMNRHVEWLGTFWSHAVAPSTPIPDLALQISAWQHQFADLFGDSALQRVRGFSLPEMHLPNHPDTLFALVNSLLEAGYHWLLVQEHSVEQLDGSPLSNQQRFAPNRLVARSCSGEEISITALIKTQGSDTKLVGQMQPCEEALGLSRQTLGTTEIPSLVSQIADGENGGVMMNEFPEAFRQANRRIRNSNPDTAALNGSEYLEQLEELGLKTSDLPRIQAVHQHRLWQRAGESGDIEDVAAAIHELSSANDGFSMEGASWTNNLSWVEGYDNVLQPMQRFSASFHQQFDQQLSEQPRFSQSPAFRDALMHLLLLETSCFRYWGQGQWTQYATDIYDQGMEALDR